MFEAVPSPFGRAEDAGVPEHGTQSAGDRSDKHLQRAKGLCRVVLSGSGAGNRIVDLYQQAPLRLMFPRTVHAPSSDVVLVNSAGGIAGGDALESAVTLLPGASVAMTSQAAEKVYRALKEPARVVTRLKVCAGAKLAWLPQETIIFNDARLIRMTEIEISTGAELLALEWLVLGRAAHGERVAAGHVADGWRVKKDGRLVWADRFRVTDEVSPELTRLALLSDCTAVGTLLYFGPDPDARLEFLRGIAPSCACRCAPTLVAGLLVIRFAARAGSDLRLGVRHILREFGRELAPGPFGIPQIWFC